MIRAFKSLLSIGLVLLLLVIFSAEARAEVEAPKIIKLTAPEFFSLAGAAPANSDVLIYLDGSFIGRAEAKILAETAPVPECRASAAGCQPSWQWQYSSTQKLTHGNHQVMAVAQDRTSLVLSAPGQEIKFAVNAVPAPILIAPNELTATADLRPLIIGLTKSQTLVKIFIDDAYNGTTGPLKDDSGTANFVYRPTLNLSRGWHKISALAEDGAGKSSPVSDTAHFKIEPPLPAPTIFKPVVNRATSLNRPFIVGLAKNDSKIKIYIDKKYQGELTVKNHSSGTANFAYKPKAALTRGEHLVYTVAVDRRGKESSWSNTINFSTKNSAIAESVREERKEVAAEIKEPKKPAKAGPEPIVISDGSGTVVKKSEGASADQTEKSTLGESATGSAGASPEERPTAVQPESVGRGKTVIEKIKSLIGADAKTTKSDQGMINEGQQRQGKLKFSIILFILFLVGVVAWLLWVNRELVKERRTQTEAEEKSEEHKK